MSKAYRIGLEKTERTMKMANIKHSILLSILMISIFVFHGCEKTDNKESELASQIKQLEAELSDANDRLEILQDDKTMLLDAVQTINDELLKAKNDRDAAQKAQQNLQSKLSELSKVRANASSSEVAIRNLRNQLNEKDQIISELEAFIKEQEATINEFQQYVDSITTTESTDSEEQIDEEPMDDSSEEATEEESETDENNV
jgi:chromosome segregation ATPase